MKPYLEITCLPGTPVPDLPMEIVERKGKGHPDVLCDKAAEELGLELCNYYLERYGRIMHYNVDKCVLAGGQSRATFGSGEVIEPIYLLLVGRAVDVVEGEERQRVPIGKFALRSTKNWLRQDLPHLDTDHDIIVDYKIRAGSTDLVGNFEGDLDVPRANDTSFGVGYAPFSELESLVYNTEKLLNAPETKKKYPGIGEDIKVMGLRQKDVMTLTIACALLCEEIFDADQYVSLKEDMRNLILDQAVKNTDNKVIVNINTADDLEKGILYLTVTGTSAE
ncbi:MAG: methionine adenosyltransferase, partial [Candidatus Ranarchaeia archaeon]